jgi:predicted dinucleotide-binding enzyme
MAILLRLISIAHIRAYLMARVHARPLSDRKTSGSEKPKTSCSMFDHNLARSRRALLRAGTALAFAAALRPWAAVAQGDVSGKARIGVVGSGHIGGTIGGLWVKAGHPVLFSSRHPDELKDLAAGLGPLAQTGTVAQAIAFGDVIFVAVPYGALPQLGQDYGAALKGKIVLDACNAVAARDGAIADEVERNGIGITSQKYLAGTRLVRAFNTLSYQIFAHEANRPAPKLAIPIAGDDLEALQVAAGLVRDAGFEPVVVGKLADARRFQRGGPGYGQAVTATELKQKLSLAP